jgi:hypothetical protein
MSRHPAVLVKELGETLAELAAADLTDVVATELADVLVDLMGCGSRLEAVTAHVAAVVDGSKVWANDGSRSCAAWLARAAHRHRGDAASVVGRGRALRDMPEACAAHAAGRLSSRHVRLLGQARDLAPEHYAADEAWLVQQALTLSFGDVSQVVAYWCHHVAPDDVEERARRRYERRSVRMSSTIDGCGVLDVDFEAVGYATFAEALRRIEHELWEHDWADARDRLGPIATKADLARSDAQRRYDALIEMAQRSMAVPNGATKPVPLVTVHIDHETLTGRVCELSTGTVLTPGEVLPLLTSADIERAVFSGASRIVDLGRTQRLFTGGTRRAVQILHPTCQHPTCAIPSNQCDIDHTVDWEHGGRTDHTNGGPYCPPHHPGRHRKNPPRRNTRRSSGDRGDGEGDGGEDDGRDRGPSG